MTVPHNLEAEESLLGAMLLTPSAIEAALPIVTSADFYRPAHGSVFDAIKTLHGRGDKADPTTVSAELKRAGLLDRVGGSAALVTLSANCPATSSAAAYARIVAGHAAQRALIVVAGEIIASAQALKDPAEIIDAARSRLEDVDLPVVGVPQGLSRLTDLLDRDESKRAPWVIPGLFRRDWRVVVVAPEGAGKTMVLQCVGIGAGQGVHPFSLTPIPPVRVLFVDVENPEDRLEHGVRLIDPHARSKSVDYDADRVWLWSRPGGLNLRTRSDVASLEAVLREVRPQLVCMGPAYKLAGKKPGEAWDEVAMATQQVLDSLRTRFGFALLLEDHAPQASGGGVRELRPFGSSAWLRWPELGFGLAPDTPRDPNKLTVNRWRGDRLPNSWPDELHRGQLWPWSGFWKDGREAA